MTDAAQSSGAGPSVCPFVALAEDRDRRADTPDEGNRCYAERAPRQRDMVYQADFCYSPQFSTCSVFLSWAARNAAEPAYVTEAAQKAWGSGIAMPEGDSGAAGPAADAPADDALPTPTPEGGLLGPSEPDEDGGGRSGSEQLAWVSASAWADAPWDERAEADADELEALAEEQPDEEPDADEAEDQEPVELEEATQAPRVPAALPMRRRWRPQQPIRSRGSGEWYYADPPGHEPLVKRRYGIAPPILLAVLALLVVSIIVFLLPTLLSGGGDGQTAAGASPSPDASLRGLATRAPTTATAQPSASPSPTPEPVIRSYTVKPGDTLSGIAAKRKVDVKLLQCMNYLKNPNVIVPGQKLQIPPDGYSCEPGWRRATPEPEAAPTAEP